MVKKKAEHAVGKRKTSIARVYLKAGTGKFVINKRDIENYFIRETAKMVVMQPFHLTNTVGKYDILVNVCGGGHSGQAGAIRHGISRILSLTPEFKTALKAHGLLTRDARKKERKMYGLKSSRARYQYSKR